MNALNQHDRAADLLGPATPTSGRPRLERDELGKSNLYGVVVTARVVGLFALSVATVSVFYERDVLRFIAAGLLLGWAAYRIQFILHDCSHRSLFRSARVNEIVGTVAGLFVGISLRSYRATHMLHHRRNGSIDDPQFPDYLGASDVSRRRFLKFVAEPLWGGRLVTHMRRQIGSENTGVEMPRDPAWWWLALVAVQVAICIALTRVGEHPEAAITFYLGMATVSLFLARLRALAEHQQMGEDRRPDFTRSHPPSFLDWLFLYDAHFNFHLEHHLYPGLQSRHLRHVYESNTRQQHDDVTWGRSMFHTLARSYQSLSS